MYTQWFLDNYLLLFLGGLTCNGQNPFVVLSWTQIPLSEKSRKIELFDRSLRVEIYRISVFKRKNNLFFGSLSRLSCFVRHSEKTFASYPCDVNNYFQILLFKNTLVSSARIIKLSTKPNTMNTKTVTQIAPLTWKSFLPNHQTILKKNTLLQLILICFPLGIRSNIYLFILFNKQIHF